jgi:hypothetical protein
LFKQFSPLISLCTLGGIQFADMVEQAFNPTIRSVPSLMPWSWDFDVIAKSCCADRVLIESGYPTDFLSQGSTRRSEAVSIEQPSKQRPVVDQWPWMSPVYCIVGMLADKHPSTNLAIGIQIGHTTTALPSTHDHTTAQACGGSGDELAKYTLS